MSFKDPEARFLFPNPFLTIRLDDSEKLNRELLKEIAKRCKTEAGIKRSNLLGWHSPNDLFDRREPAHAKLAAELVAIVGACSQKMIPDLPKDLPIRHEGWINLSPTNALNAPHDHPSSFWSGTYYVAVPPPDDPTDKYSGAIEFIDPRGSMGSSARIETPFTRSKFTVRPTAGTCFLWPSYLKHWVHPNRSSQDRVTIAFNSWFPRGPQRAGG